MTLDFSRPSKPTDNAFVESFNGRLRDECLNTHWFLSLDDARAKIETWRRHYNESRPHTSLGWMKPGGSPSNWRKIRGTLTVAQGRQPFQRRIHHHRTDEDLGTMCKGSPAHEAPRKVGGVILYPGHFRTSVLPQLLSLPALPA